MNVRHGISFAVFIAWTVFVMIGCTGVSSIQAGYTSPFPPEHQEGHRGVGVDGHIGAGFGDAVGLDVNVGAKLAKRDGNIGAGLGLYVIHVPFLLRGNVRVIDLGAYEGEFVAGMGSPSAELGFVIPFGIVPGNVGDGAFFITGSSGYNVRFGSHAPNEGWWGVQLGYGIVFSTSGLR